MSTKVTGSRPNTKNSLCSIFNSTCFHERLFKLSRSFESQGYLISRPYQGHMEWINFLSILNASVIYDDMWPVRLRQRGIFLNNFEMHWLYEAPLPSERWLHVYTSQPNLTLTVAVEINTKTCFEQIECNYLNTTQLHTYFTLEFIANYFTLTSIYGIIFSFLF